MNGISSWATAISICAIICTIVEMLISDSKLEKTVRFVLGAFMICAIIMPITDMTDEISEVDFNITMSDDSKEKFDIQKIELFKKQISSLVTSILSEENIYPQKIDVNMDIDENNSISIISVTVVLKKQDVEKANRVSYVIKTQLGLECNTVFSD